jgi:hypothetical protein|tara:strand:+ start:45 stop:311 length:267 start_codon:yes stop_codon:yes gene_type:complete
MTSLTDKYSKNFSSGKKKEFEKRVSEMVGNMSELAAIQLVLTEMFQEGKKDGGMIDKPLGSGGVKSGPPPKRGPNPQGLNVPLKQVKT